MLDELKNYSGRSWAVAVLIREAAEDMQKRDVKELEIDHKIGGETVKIRIKR